MNPETFFQQLDDRGRKMGVRFGPQPLMSNSRMAMEGGEFAREHGRYEAYHEAVFRAFFTDCLDIGDRAVILGMARTVGLDTDQLTTALESGIYLPRLEVTTRNAKMRRISSAPTFIVDGYRDITGAQPIDTFRTILRDVEKTANRAPSVSPNYNAEIQ